MDRYRDRFGLTRVLTVIPPRRRSAASGASLTARYFEKKTRRFFDLFRAPPLPVSPGSSEVDPMMDQNRRSG